jgi:transcriptional regulator with XRE-family HTH domain
MIEARSRDVRLHFAQRLKELRAARGFRTARSLAHALAIDENRYTRYERAEVEPDLTLLMRICEALRATPNDLLVGWAQPSAERPLEGFAEKAESTGLATRATARPDLRDGELAVAGAEPSGRRASPRALAWRLASELAQLRTKQAAPLTILRAKFRVFTEIERDPLSFIGRWAEDPALSELDPQEQARIAALMDDLIGAVSGGHRA